MSKAQAEACFLYAINNSLMYFDISFLFLPSDRSYYTYSSEPFHPLPGRTPAWKSPYEAMEVIQSGH